MARLTHLFPASQAVAVAAVLVLGVLQQSIVADLSDFGPYAVGTATVTVSRPNGSTFSALLFYPATTGGANAPLDTSGGPYSAITFGHGFLQVPSRYSRTMSHLASYGHIVIASNSETGLFPSHSNFANDMRFTLNYLETRNSTPGDPFFGQVNTAQFGLFGHSMGGGAGLLATAADSRIRAYAGLASAITNPSPVSQMANIRVPVALMTGNQDGIVDYTTNSLVLYNAGLAPKLLPIIEGGFHVGFQDDPYPIFPDSGSIPRETQLAITRAYLTSYFGLYLRDDQSLWRNIWGPEAVDTSGLATQSQSVVGISVDQSSQVGVAGQTMNYTLTITNLGPQANQFRLFVEDNSWSAVFSEDPTPILQPGQSHLMNFQVLVPNDAQAGQIDLALVSARSEFDRGTRAFVILHTEACTPAQLVNSQLYHASYSGPDSEGWGKIDSVKSVMVLGQEQQSVQLDHLSASSSGINGILLDVQAVNDWESLQLNYAVSPQGAFHPSENGIADWQTAPAPSSLTAHPGAGLGGSDRLLLLWPDGVISNRYLYVRLADGDRTIAELLVGHLGGEQTGASDGVFTVAFSDLAQIRGSVGQSVDAGSPADIDKNGVVSFADISSARLNVGSQLTQINVVATAWNGQ